MSKRKVAYYFLAIVIIGSLVWIFTKSENGAPTYEPAKVIRGDVLHSVSVTGYLEPVAKINLAFPVGGYISALFVEEGEEVLGGTVVAVLDGGIQQSTLHEAQTRVERERALLRDITAPLRDEERALKNVSVANAQLAVERSRESARTVLARAFVFADDAIHEKADELFENTQSDSPKLGVSFSYGNTKYILQASDDLENQINAERRVVGQVLIDMQARAQNPDSEVEEALLATDNDLKTIESFLTKLALVANKYVFDDSINQVVYESFQTSVTSARTAISTARSEVSTAYTAYTSAVASLVLAESDRNLSEAGVSSDTIAAQKASVATALAAVGTASERAKDTVLTVPFDGVLSRVDFEVGEIVSPYQPVAQLITQGVSEVEVFIPEADIANVKLGDIADVTFDAYGKDILFTAEVIRIAYSETVKEGVPTYKTTLRLSNPEREGVFLRSGMTADVEIYTDVRSNVLFVPTRSVLRSNGRTYVRVFDGEEFQEKDIVTGLRGSEGTIEVVRGLVEGEEVVLYVEES